MYRTGEVVRWTHPRKLARTLPFSVGPA